MSVADDLITRLEDATQLPLEPAVYRQVRLWEAFRETDDAYLQTWAGWTRHRRLICDPLADQIASAHADLLFGDEPSITAANQRDEDNLAGLVDASNLESELHRAARITSSESEVWWRVYVDREASDYPLVQWVSRLGVEVLWRAGRPVAIAFVSVLEASEREWVRHVEVHAKGETRNLLYAGNRDTMGRRVSLNNHEETVDLPDLWKHDPLMLAGRVINRPSDRGLKLGKSDYQGLEGMLHALNESTTIMAENMRSTGKKRTFVDGQYLDERGRLIQGDDVFRKDDGGSELGKPGGGMSQADYTFEAAQQILHDKNLTEKIVTRAGLVPQWVGVMEQGSAESGTALRVRLLPAILSAEGKARIWTDELPRIIGVMQMVDAMSERDGGFGRQWADAASEPQVDLGDPIPKDQTEEATVEALLVTSGLRSKRTSIEKLRPDWGEEEVDEELARIQAEHAAAMPEAFADPSRPAPKEPVDESVVRA